MSAAAALRPAGARGPIGSASQGYRCEDGHDHSLMSDQAVKVGTDLRDEDDETSEAVVCTGPNKDRHGHSPDSMNEWCPVLGSRRIFRKWMPGPPDRMSLA